MIDFLTRLFLNYSWQSDNQEERMVVNKHIREEHKTKGGENAYGGASGRAYSYCTECAVIEVREWCWDGTLTKDYYIGDESNLIRRDFIN